MQAARTAARSICGCRPGRSRQPERAIDDALQAGIVAGAYWLRPPAPGADLAIVYSGAVAPEALAAHAGRRRHAGRRACSPSPRPAGCSRLAGGAPRPRRRRPRPKRQSRRCCRCSRPCRAGHRHRRPSGDAVVARRGGAARDRAARGRPFRPVGRHPGSLPLHGIDADAILDAVAELYVRRARRRRSRPVAA